MKKLKKHHLYTIITVGFIVIVIPFLLWHNTKKEEQRRTAEEQKKSSIVYDYEIDFSSQWNFSKQVFFVKPGNVLFEVPDGFNFIIDADNKKAISQNLWGDVVFITVSAPFYKEKKKISASKCQVHVPLEGELIVQVEFNNKKFNPLVNRVWTGYNEAGDFIRSPGVVKITNNFGAREIPKIASLSNISEPEEIVITEKDSSADKTIKKEKAKEDLFSDGKSVFSRAIGQEKSKHNIFSEPVDTTELGKDVKEAWKVKDEIGQGIKKKLESLANNN